LDAIVYILHSLDSASNKWEKQVLDAKGLGCWLWQGRKGPVYRAKISCEDVICADLNGDGQADIRSVGCGTKNVKVYWNERNTKMTEDTIRIMASRHSAFYSPLL
jgi:hypothetical protein